MNITLVHGTGEIKKRQAQWLKDRLSKHMAQPVKILSDARAIKQNGQNQQYVVIGSPSINKFANVVCSYSKFDAIFQNLDEDGFVLKRINYDGSKILLIGANSEKSCWYGCGRLIRSLVASGKKNLFSGNQKIDKPDMETRGIFMPLYVSGYSVANDASVWLTSGKIDLYQRYLEELMPYGLNTLLMWYPMAYSGAPWESDEAKKQWQLWLQACNVAKSLGLKLHIILFANLVPHAYVNKYPDLAAEEYFGLWGYPAFCPSKPRARKLLIQTRKWLFENLPEHELIQVYPTDLGGCGCKKCTPWHQTYLELSEQCFDLAKRYRPQVKCMVNFWYFTPTQIEKMIPIIMRSPNITDVGVQIPTNKNCGRHFKVGAWKMYWPLPKKNLMEKLARKKNLIVFNDITEKGAWGEFGTYPVPNHIKICFDSFPQSNSFMSYSEGRYDHINKLLALAFGWNRNQNATKLCESVCCSEFGPTTGKDVAKFVESLEVYDWKKARTTLEKIKKNLGKTFENDYRWMPLVVFSQHAELSHEIYRAAKQFGKMLRQSQNAPTLAKMKQKARQAVVFFSARLESFDTSVRKLSSALHKLYYVTSDLKEKHNLLGPKALTTRELEKVLELDWMRDRLGQLSGFAPNRSIMEIETASLFSEMIGNLAEQFDDFKFLNDKIVDKKNFRQILTADFNDDGKW